MPWFRFKRKSSSTQQEAAQDVAVVEEAPPAEAEPESVEDAQAGPAATGADGAPTRKRRRGSRGGRNRRKPGEAGAASEEAPEPAPEPAAARSRTKTRERKEPAERSDRRRSSGRRRQPPRRAPLPAAKRELVISVDIGEQRVAVLEDDRVAEVYLERPERRSIAGNIYLGVVDNVLPGMEAAFVEIGLEKNGFLYVDEIVVPELEGKRHGKKIQDLISRGEQLLVQAVKDPMKTKGARLTTEISLPGRFVVYVPNGEGLGVSRRLEDAERARLKEIIRALDVKEGGVIVRTAAEGASAEDVERDLVFLQRLWKTIQARAKAAKAPELVYQEAELPLRIVRDLFAGDFEAAYVDSDRTHRRIVGYLKKTSPHMVERVHRDKEREPLFQRYGVDREIESTLSRRVDLPSGGYLVFDYAEAFTVIDVNTGRFVGSRSKNTTQRLEDTITKNNLEAVKEVVRQLRLRDIGGIIVIDFIDMANPKNRATVEEALRTELERDRTKTYVVEISPLGLVEMTRQNVTDGPREILTRKCPVCAGDGIVVSDQTVAMQVERKLRALATPGTRVQAYRIALHPRILDLVVGPAGGRLAALEEAAKRRFFLVPAEGHVHEDHLEVLAEGKLDDLRPERAVTEGAELDLKLVEVGRHDAGAAVGKVDGYDVAVAGAAKLVGKRAKAHVVRALDASAYASLVGVAEGPAPITFESEAEKPTRAPSRRKAAPAAGEAVASLEAEAEVGAEVEVEPAPEEEAVRAVAVETAEVAEEGEEPEPAEGEALVVGEDGQPVKRKTRRGSRGGRRRKKKPAVPGAEGAEEAEEAEAAEAAAEAPAEPEAGPQPVQEGEAEPEAAAPKPKPAARPARKRTPRIHVPAAEPAPPATAAAIVAAGRPPAADEVTADDGEPAEPELGVGEESEDGAAPAKRKTRRGSRGGRSRRKKTPAGEVEADGGASVENGAEPDAAPVAEVVPAGVVEDASGYVPMDEWIDDFGRARD